jgi:hypothetical protein
MGAVVGYEDWGLNFWFLDRRMKKKISIAAMAITTTPPTEPPTMAPIGVGDGVGTVVGTVGLVTEVVGGVVITVVDVEVEVGTVVEEAEAHGAPIEPLISS